MTISLKCGKEFDRVSPDLQQEFNRPWSKVKVTACRKIAKPSMTSPWFVRFGQIWYRV